jgi:hypothetical protein
MYFKAGRLYFALTTAITGPRDAVLWVEMQPQLSTQAAHNPQWINGADYVQTGIFYFSDLNTDVYLPTQRGRPLLERVCELRYPTELSDAWGSLVRRRVHGRWQRLDDTPHRAAPGIEASAHNRMQLWGSDHQLPPSVFW